MQTSMGHSPWHAYSDGNTLYGHGPEQGVIIRDEERADDARITLERGTATAPFAITCAIYGRLVHTMYLPDASVAEQVFQDVKGELEAILALSSSTTAEDPEERERKIASAISSFVMRYLL